MLVERQEEGSALHDTRTEAYFSTHDTLRLLHACVGVVGSTRKDRGAKGFLEVSAKKNIRKHSCYSKLIKTIGTQRLAQLAPPEYFQ